jgi:hypothetical protein
MPAVRTAPYADCTAAAGLLLVAEVEAYLRSIAVPGRPVPTAQTSALGISSNLDEISRPLFPAPRVCRYGSVLQPWNATVPAAEPTLLDRLRHRPVTTPVTVQQHLELTSRYIAAHGWAQGMLWDRDGRVCVLGAQFRVLQAGYGTEETVRRARLRIGNELGRLGQGMPVDEWNDRPGRHQAEVHRLLERAAARF